MMVNQSILRQCVGYIKFGKIKKSIIYFFALVLFLLVTSLFFPAGTHIHVNPIEKEFNNTDAGDIVHLQKFMVSEIGAEKDMMNLNAIKDSLVIADELIPKTDR